LEFIDDGTWRATLLILPHVQDRLGIYLKFIGERSRDEYLSCHDRARLAEVAECGDEWYASVGLFLPKEKAWAAIEEFMRSGRRTGAVEWIRSTEIPQGGNS
jgi:hypothetical protein